MHNLTNTGRRTVISMIPAHFTATASYGTVLVEGIVSTRYDVCHAIIKAVACNRGRIFCHPVVILIWRKKNMGAKGERALLKFTYSVHFAPTLISVLTQTRAQANHDV